LSNHSIKTLIHGLVATASKFDVFHDGVLALARIPTFMVLVFCILSDRSRECITRWDVFSLPRSAHGELPQERYLPMSDGKRTREAATFDQRLWWAGMGNNEKISRLPKRRASRQNAPRAWANNRPCDDHTVRNRLPALGTSSLTITYFN
jgi:hypothetical protein